MTVLMVRFETTEQGAAPVAEAVEAAFAAVAREHPEGIRYQYYRRGGSNEFVALLELAGPAVNPLFGIEAAGRLQAAMAEWAIGGPPVPAPLELLGWYESGD
ncbi:MAG TPA: hypothetical protein VGG16_16245 [Streptosporangiaceae bacterium]